MSSREMPHTDFLSVPTPSPNIKSCHHHLSSVIKAGFLDPDGHLVLLPSTNGYMEPMISRILTETFKYIVSCYQLVTMNAAKGRAVIF